MSDIISLSTIPVNFINMTNRINRVQNLSESEKSFSSGKNEAELKNTCAELESLFIYQLIKEMRATIPKSGFINGGKAEEIYTSMLDSQMAKQLSLNGGIGLSSILYEQLCSKQEDCEHPDDEKKDDEKKPE